MMNSDSASQEMRQLREHLLELLTGTSAHVGLIESARDFPPTVRGVKHPKFPHTAWELLEHIRIAQWDIIEYSKDPQHQSPNWPDDYWPNDTAPPNEVGTSVPLCASSASMFSFR